MLALKKQSKQGQVVVEYLLILAVVVAVITFVSKEIDKRLAVQTEAAIEAVKGRNLTGGRQTVQEYYDGGGAQLVTD